MNNVNIQNKQETKYITISLPIELFEEVQEYIQYSKLGFKTPTEFIKSAIRHSLINYNKKEATESA
jgi:metal-responsive CopG/Arc/MetJ family transcriptional regulator